MMENRDNSDTDALLVRLRQYLAALKMEAATTSYPDRAESLPRMIDNLTQAMRRLEKDRAA